MKFNKILGLLIFVPATRLWVQGCSRLCHFLVRVYATGTEKWQTGSCSVEQNSNFLPSFESMISYLLRSNHLRSASLSFAFRAHPLWSFKLISQAGGSQCLSIKHLFSTFSAYALIAGFHCLAFTLVPSARWTVLPQGRNANGPQRMSRWANMISRSGVADHG